VDKKEGKVRTTTSKKENAENSKKFTEKNQGLQGKGEGGLNGTRENEKGGETC